MTSWKLPIFPLMSLGDRSKLMTLWLFPQTQLAWFDLNISMWSPIVTFLFHNHDGPWPDSIKVEQKNREIINNFKWWHTPYTCPVPGKGGREGQPVATSVCFIPATPTTSGDKSHPQKLGMYLHRGVQGKSHIQAHMDGVFDEVLNGNDPL